MAKYEHDTAFESYTSTKQHTVQFQFGLQSPDTVGIGFYVWSKYLLSAREATNFNDIKRWVDSTVEPAEVTNSNSVTVE